MFQRQIGEILLPPPGKLGLFLISALFCTRVSQKLGTPTQLKTTFRIDIEHSYPLKNFRLDKLKITFSICNCKKIVFNYISCKKPLKAPGN